MSKSNWKVYTNYTIIMLLVFQPMLENIGTVFTYCDEFLALLFFFNYIFKVLKTKKIQLHKLKIFVLIILLIVVGIVGNFRFDSNQKIIAILIDMLSNLKIYLFSIPALSVYINARDREKLSDLVSVTIRILILIMFCCAICSQFYDIGMSGEIRYGLRAFKFLLSNPAGLNTYFYTYIIVFSATLFRKEKLRKYSNWFMLMAVVTWILTLRSRAIAFAVIYIVLYWFLIIKKTNRANFSFKWYYAAAIAAVAVLIGWPTFEEYFLLNSRQARYVLLRGAIEIAKEQLPFGTGFGTFGTAVSSHFYSSVYSMYGMSSIWGLSSGDSYFITDQYWCGILGQFGVVGVIIVGVLIYILYKLIWIRAKTDTACILATITLIYTSLLASLAAATFIQASILASIYVIVLLSEKDSGASKI